MVETENYETIIETEMRILLLGEYSNVHWTLAEGLRVLGHDVVVASNGDYWKNYHRDVSLVRKSNGLCGTLGFLAQLAVELPQMRGFDVVQLINPMFLDLKSQRVRPIYEYLRKHNKKVFLGAYGMDYYWVNTCRTTQTFRYSDFNFGETLRTDDAAMAEVADWIGTDKGRLNQQVAKDCDGIIAGLYEYYACYHPVFPDKTRFIPFPINIHAIRPTAPAVTDGVVRFFIGVQRARSAYKGTDVMLRALERVAKAYPGRCEVVKAESVPYHVYQHMMDTSHVLLDQLYSYTPAMNGLLAMAKGMVLVGGGEPENYDILGERDLRPIVNVVPDEDDVYRKLEQLVLHPDDVERRSAGSRLYIERHHNYCDVARQYIDFWTNSK